MRTITTIIISVLVSLSINAQDFKRASFVSMVNGPVMLDSIEKPDRVPSDILWEEKVFFDFDMDSMILTMSTLKEKKEFKILSIYKHRNSEDATRTYVSRGFDVESIGTVIITLTGYKYEEGEEHLSIQIEKEYNEHFVREWLTHYYYISLEDANFVK